MATILLYTGNAGPGIALAAAATALRSAQHGHRTLLLSLGPPQGLAALLGTSIGGAASEVAPRLDALAIDGLAELAAEWGRSRQKMPPQIAQVAGDELPLLPGAEMLFGLLRLGELAPRYAAVVVDAGPHDALVRALALPDGLRWGVRLLFGLDRGPGKSPGSVARAALPTSFIPIDAIDRVQELRVQAERLRALVTGTNAAARFVLRPDRAALAEARVGIAALHLHGVAVPAIVAGPLLPPALDGSAFAAVQDAVLAEARAAWPHKPLLRFTLPESDASLAPLGAIGEQIEPGAATDHRAASPIAETWKGAPALAVDLPGLPKGELQLTLSGDELIVRVGPYRRHILLPDSLRGTSAIRATREGEQLVVRRRNESERRA